jgi:transglutaminase-like putative cysteine protease
MKFHRFLILPTLLALVLLAACTHADPHRPRVADVPPDADQYYYAIEMNGTLAGYAHVVAFPDEVEGRQVTVIRQKLFMLLNLLGSEFNTEVDQLFHVDPESGMSLYGLIDSRQGSSRFEWSARVEGDVAHMSSTLGGGDRTVRLPPGAVFTNPLFLTHVQRDFIDGGAEQKSYDFLELREGEVQQVVYTRVADETLELRGESWETLVLDEDHVELGFKLRLWVDRESATVVQVELPNDRRVYLAEPRVVRSIEVANLTEDVVSRAGVMIPDYQAITYMKVRAVFQPTGARFTPELLNVPGQRFEGTVENNRVEGVFEIRHPRYDGAGAPAFPVDLGGDETLRQYLEPSLAIESDDPLLIAHAAELTEGAADAWEAATRISAWVANNIQYAIPGGGTARRTFDQRAGECGSHSVLVAALNRAVGIPARLVWGCQYIPNHGGSFGQHGWNEVYMGAAVGWVPLDATSNEIDYVDSAHIRIGEFESAASSLNPVEVEILEYRLGDGELVVPAEGAGDAPVAADAVPERYRPYVGHYRGPGGMPFSVTVDHGALVVRVEQRAALPMLDPDDEGIWRCKLTPDLYVTFDRDADGAVTTLWLHEIVRMRKIAEAEEIHPDVPPALRGHLGTYLLLQINQEFTTTWNRGTLAMRQGDSGGFSPLQEDPDEAGTWVSQTTGNRITFDVGEDGQVSGLTVDSASRVVRR